MNEKKINNLIKNKQKYIFYDKKRRKYHLEEDKNIQYNVLHRNCKQTYSMTMFVISFYDTFKINSYIYVDLLGFFFYVYTVYIYILYIYSFTCTIYAIYGRVYLKQIFAQKYYTIFIILPFKMNIYFS